MKTSSRASAAVSFQSIDYDFERVANTTVPMYEGSRKAWNAKTCCFNPKRFTVKAKKFDAVKEFERILFETNEKEISNAATMNYHSMFLATTT